MKANVEIKSLKVFELGSLKFSFQLGWAFIISLLVVASIFMVARVSLTHQIQEDYVSYCRVLEANSNKSYELQGKKDPIDTFGICKSAAYTDFEIIKAFNAWSYDDVYGATPVNI